MRTYRGFARAFARAIMALIVLHLGAFEATAQKKGDKKQNEPKVSKEESEYLKVRQYTVDLYAKSPEFRAEVDESLRQLQRDHSEYAFVINMTDADDEQYTRKNDKVKIYDALYDHPLVQDYVNRLGQSLVPRSSTKRYAFRVMLNPVPEARSLSTGTVYVSTGLISLTDNEAQLAYVLAHEIAHVEKEHWKEDVMVERGLERFNESKLRTQKLIRGGVGIATSIFGFGRGYGSVFSTSQLVELAVPTVVKLVAPTATVTWEKGQEDEADATAFQLMLDRNYDVREVPHFYASLKQVSERDTRAESGFMARMSRVLERETAYNGLIVGASSAGLLSPKLHAGAVNLRLAVGSSTPAPVRTGPPTPSGPAGSHDLPMTGDRAESANNRINAGPVADELRRKLEAGEIIGASGEFQSVLGELNRDNGVRAFYYDMFPMAIANLEKALRIRSNDAQTHFYYGKVLRLTARKASEKARALSAFETAIRYDQRRVLPEARLYKALALIERAETTRGREIVENLKDYVLIYQKQNGGALPNDIGAVYDYLRDAGEVSWSASPAINVSTKNIEPIGVTQGAVNANTQAASSSPATAPAPSQKTPARGGRRQ